MPNSKNYLKNPAVMAAAFVLAGCISTTKPVTVEHYTILGSKSAPHENASSSTGAKAPVLRVGQISAPDWLQSTNMYYRLAYRNGAQIAAYSRSDWVAPPPAQLGDRVRRVLAKSGQWSAILGLNDVAPADLGLNIELNDFEQRFASRNQSAGIVDASATLLDNNANRVVAQHRFHIEKPAPSPDAQGGVKALGKASRAFANKLAGWLRHVRAAKARSPSAEE
jgi:cholesterol transport system auxiliary component